MTVYDHSFYEEQAPASQRSARSILPLVFEHYRPESVIDVGCGVGGWLECAQALGAQEILGLDGDYIDRRLLRIDSSNFQPADLTQPLHLARTFDLALCLEVAEHLPYERSESLVADLARLSDVILFSAALPYQGGTDHVNEQWLEFWAILFRREGYVAFDPLRSKIRANPAVEFWYSQNVVIFCHAERAASFFPPVTSADRMPLSFVHPMTFIVNVARYRPYSEEAMGFEFNDYLALLEANLAGATEVPPLSVTVSNSWRSGTPLFPQARTTIMDAGEELRQREARIEALSGELSAVRDSLSGEISALRNSLSWRITSPFRALLRSVLGPR